MDRTVDEEVDRNFEAFGRRLPELMKSHAGKHALMRDAEIVEYFDTFRDAFVAGRKLFPDQLFSVQEVTDKVVRLGYRPRALSVGPV